jgi:putative transposase
LLAELKESIRAFVEYYSYQRYHQWLGDVTPYEVCTGRYLEIIQRRKEAKKWDIKGKKGL